MLAIPNLNIIAFNWSNDLANFDPNQINVFLPKGFTINEENFQKTDFTRINQCNYSDYITTDEHGKTFVRYFPAYHPFVLERILIDGPLILTKIDPKLIEDSNTTFEILKSLKEKAGISHIPEPLFIYGHGTP